MESAQLEIVAASGFTLQKIRRSPLTFEENHSLRLLAIRTIIADPGAFARESAIRTVNMLAGPDKNLLTVLGIKKPNLGVIRQIGGFKKYGSAIAWGLLSFQVMWTGFLYLLVIKTIYDVYKGRRLSKLLWCCTIFVIYVLLLSFGAPGDPRYRWPVIPLLIIFGAAALDSTEAKIYKQNQSRHGAKR